MYLFPQELSFLRKFSRSSTQVDILFGLAPTGIHNLHEGERLIRDHNKGKSPMIANNEVSSKGIHNFQGGNAVSSEGDRDDNEVEGNENEVDSEDEVNKEVTNRKEKENSEFLCCSRGTNLVTMCIVTLMQVHTLDLSIKKD